MCQVPTIFQFPDQEAALRSAVGMSIRMMWFAFNQALVHGCVVIEVRDIAVNLLRELQPGLLQLKLRVTTFADYQPRCALGNLVLVVERLKPGQPRGRAFAQWY